MSTSEITQVTFLQIFAPAFPTTEISSRVSSRIRNTVASQSRTFSGFQIWVRQYIAGLGGGGSFFNRLASPPIGISSLPKKHGVSLFLGLGTRHSQGSDDYPLPGFMVVNYFGQIWSDGGFQFKDAWSGQGCLNGYRLLSVFKNRITGSQWQPRRRGEEQNCHVRFPGFWIYLTIAFFC